MNTSNLTTGRIVQYLDRDLKAWPAIITEIDRDNGEITLTVFKSHVTDYGIKAPIRPAKANTDLDGSWWWPVPPAPKLPKQIAKEEAKPDAA